MFSVDCVAWICIVVRARCNLAVAELPSGAASIHTMSSPGDDSIVSLAYDLTFPVNQNSANLTPRACTEAGQIPGRPKADPV